MHLRDRGGGDRRPEARIDRGERLLERLGDDGFGLLLAEGRHLVLQHFEVAGDVRADDVGPRGEELAELDVGRPEPGQRRAETAGAVAGAAALDQPAEADGPDDRHRQAARVDHAEHAFAREHVAGARQPDEMSGGGDHNFQPECSATTPPVICRNETRRKPAASIIRAKACGLGNLRIELDEVLIGLAVAGHRLADARDDLERIELVERVEPRHVDRGELQAQEAAADLEHAVGLGERAVDARHVADAEGDGDAVEALVGVGQFLGIALLEGDGVVEAALDGALGADRQHLGIDVADGDAGVRPAGLRDAEGDVAGAAGEVEQRERPVPLRRIHGSQQGVLPGAVQAAGHQVVHEVVAAGDGMEDVVDPPLLVREGNGRIAEMGLVAGCRHSRIVLCGQDHSAGRAGRLCVFPCPGRSAAWSEA